MAHGYLARFVPADVKVYSAGVETHGLNPGAVKAMGEDGIDITGHTSNLIDEYAEVNFDFIITVCDHAKEKCPYFPSSAVKFHRNFEDPSKSEGTEAEKEAAFRRTRDAIKAYCNAFVNAYVR